jgi:hypothetical protein
MTMEAMRRKNIHRWGEGLAVYERMQRASRRSPTSGDSTGLDTIG